MRSISRLSFILLAATVVAGCSAGMVARTGETAEASTEDFDVTIEQTNAPVLESGARTTDVRFEIHVKNRTAEPWTIDRIALQSMGGGAYVVPARIRTYERVVAPGKEEAFEFWASADVRQDVILAKAPITMRTTLYAKTDGNERREQFMQSLNGRLTLTGNQ